MKLAFLVTEGLMCLYDKQYNAWLLVDMGEKLHIYTRPCIILYFLRVTISAVKTLETQISLARTARCLEKKHFQRLELENIR